MLAACLLPMHREGLKFAGTKTVDFENWINPGRQNASR